MRIKVLILEEKTERWKEGTPDAGQSEVLVCADRSAAGERMVDTFLYKLRNDEISWKGCLDGRQFDIIIEDFDSNKFSGRLTARGRIDPLSIQGSPMPVKPEPVKNADGKEPISSSSTSAKIR